MAINGPDRIIVVVVLVFFLRVAFSLLQTNSSLPRCTSLAAAPDPRAQIRYGHGSHSSSFERTIYRWSLAETC
uniref:Uncharacterized protein n=1 Tax=Kalanchoe fedtschenkoi TaxID=63787 RepID=A0A7N0U8D7_KALFE